MSNWIDKAVQEMADMTPTTGFNVVGVDPTQPAGDALYLVGHFEDRAAADKAAAAHTERTGNAAHVYEPPR